MLWARSQGLRRLHEKDGADCLTIETRGSELKSAHLQVPRLYVQSLRLTHWPCFALRCVANRTLFSWM